MAENVLVPMSVLNIKWGLRVLLLTEWIFRPIRKQFGF